MCPPIDERRLAAIDVGSNSIKMLAADVSAASFVRIIGRGSITVRLQSGLKGDRLSEDAIFRAAEAIASLAEKARALGATCVEAFGTSALRDAANSDEVCRKVWDTCGVRLRVISGEEEALSAYAAVAGEGRKIVVNPGGGSTEMALGENTEPLRAVSSHIGAVSLKAEGKPMEKSVAYAEAILKPDWLSLGAKVGDSLYFSGGTATCAAAVLLGLAEYDPQAIERYPLRKAEAEALAARLFSMPIAERCTLPGLSAERADILPYGLAILIAFFNLSGRNEALVTDRNNLYGFLRRMYTETAEK